ncbi:MAG: hypothetical protein ACLFNK_01170 [Candidatus Woesearchaeota archaeon]
MASGLSNSKRGSMELSVNFIVKLILALVVFGFGLMIIRNIMSTAGSGELTREIDDQMESQIQMLMDTGDRIVIFPEEQSLSIGDVGTFALGILNVLDLPDPPVDFEIDVQCHSFVSNEGTSSEDCDYAESWTFDSFPPMTIPNNDEESTGIAIRPGDDAELGTYVFNVKVDYDHDSESGTYGITKFRVNVEK